MSSSSWNILYNKTHVSLQNLEESRPLINRLLRNELRYPQIKKLSGIDYHKHAVYRLKIDAKARLIFTYLKNYNEEPGTVAKSSLAHPSHATSIADFAAHQLFILEIDPDHNYDRLKHRLENSTCPKIEEFAIEEMDEEVELPRLAEDTSPIKWEPATIHNQKTIIFDEEQQAFFVRKGPSLLSGPPGSGKTVVIYQKMLDDLRNMPEALPSEPLPILFLSSSKLLIHNVKGLYQTDSLNLERKVEFFTWEQLLATHYPEYQIQTEANFHQWLLQNLFDDIPKQVHFDFSLIAAFGPEKYLTFSDRQCYYSREPQKQKEIVKLYQIWITHLEENKFFDPMVSPLKHSINYAAFYFDETQNLPPIALESLIPYSAEKQFDLCLDSEQSLISFPFIKVCLKNLAYQHGFVFEEYQLSKTWRSPPEIVAIANHLMDAKYKLDGKNQRREQRDIQSNLPSGTGRACWIQKADFSKITPLGQSAKTLVVVFEKPNPAERERINQALGSNNILTPEEIIGFDFDTVILWNPLSQQKHLHKLTEGFVGPLNLDQWLSLNRLYVAITRTQSSLFIYDLEQKRFDKLAKMLLGDALTSYQNTPEQPQTLSIENKQELWLKQVDEHLLAKNWDAAKQIMEFHLKMDSSDIEKKLQEYGDPSVVKKSEPTPQASSSATSSNVAKKKTTGKNRQKEDKVPTQAPPVSKVSTVANKTLSQDAAKAFLNCLSQRNEKSLQCLEMLNKKPGLMKGISSKFISLILTQPSLINKDFSFLYYLSTSSTGQALLSRIFDEQPEIAKDIKAEDLCRERPLAAGPNANTSVLYWLAANFDGHVLLTRIFDEHPEIIKDIKAEDLRRAVRQGADPNAKTSVLYWLVLSPGGRKILTRILDEHPEIIKGIKAENLCPVPPQTAGEDTNTFVMCSSDKNVENPPEMASQEVTNWLKSSGFQGSIDKPAPDGMGAIHFAAIHGNCQVIHHLLSNKLATLKDLYGPINETPLLRACCSGQREVVKYLLDHGSSLNERDIKGDTPLLTTCMYGHLEIVQYLIERGSKLQERSKNGHTALIRAAMNGKIHVVQYLLEAGAKADEVDKDGYTPLLCAAIHGHLDLIKYLLNGFSNINEYSIKGNTAVLCAARDGHLEIIKWLANNGAKITDRNRDGTSVMIRASVSGHEKLVQWMIENYPETVRDYDKIGNTPLHYAAMSGHLSVVEALLKAGAVVTERNLNKYTPLICAAIHSRINIIEFLLTKGASLEEEDKDGYTPMLCTALHGHLEALKYLVEKTKKDPKITGKKTHAGLTLMLCAARRGHTHVMEYLIKEQLGSIADRDKAKDTPLIIAAMNGHIKSLEWLIEQGALISETNSEGHTPLIRAAMNGKIEVMELLLMKGASLEEEDQHGFTPMLCTTVHGHLDALKYIVEKTKKDPKITGQRTSTGQTLMLCAAGRGHTHVMEYLINEQLGSLADRDKNKNTPLICAAECGHIKSLEWLIEQGALVSETNSDGNTPIIRAAKNGQIETVKKLLNYEASITESDMNGFTPAIRAVALRGHLLSYSN